MAAAAMAAVAAVAASLPAQAAPGLQFAELGKRHLPVELDETRTVAYGDVDGDGDLDMVVGNGFPGQNRLYLNNGSGTFSDATAGRMPVDYDQTNSVALGDIDGDGDLDLVIANRGQDRLYLNNGSGTFSDATTSRMPVAGGDARSVALGDVDGDGDLDMVIGNSGSTGVGEQNELYLNDGTGTFSDATAGRIPVVNDYTRSVALGDVDGDGDLDIVTGNWLHHSRLYLNNGSGTFSHASANWAPAINDYASSVALGDADGDGDLDIVMGNGQRNRLYLNNGLGTFSDVTSTKMPALGGGTTSLALGDVDSDGDLDLVCGNLGQQDGLYLNDGAGTFAEATANRLPADIDYTSSVALGDIDGDGDLDLAVGNTSGWPKGQQNRLYLNSGTGSFSDATASRMPVNQDNTNTVVLGDVDGDGDLDLVLGNYDQQNRLYLNDDSGTFTDATAGQMPVANDRTTSVTLGDVDGDGDLDMVIGNDSQQNRLYLNNGAGAFSDATSSQMPAANDSTTSLALGDVDGDGDLDLVIGNDYQQNRLYLNNGSGAFSDATASRMPIDNDYTSSVAFGDVDGDGDLDMVIGNLWQQNRLYLNNGAGTFADATASQMPVAFDRTTSLALGDVDGDGDLDMVIGNDSQQHRLHLNNGSGIFSSATAGQMPAFSDLSRSVALGDLDGDGDLDVVCGIRGQNRLHLNNGSGTFFDATVRWMPVVDDTTNSVALGDVDADGDLDMVIGNDRQTRLYSNLQHQIDAPHLLRSGHPFTLDAYSRFNPPSALDVALTYLSTTRQSIPLPPYGILGIDPMAALLPIFIAQPDGVGRTTWTVPNNPAFAGIEIFAQAAIVHWPGTIRLTNVTADVMLR